MVTVKIARIISFFGNLKNFRLKIPIKNNVAKPGIIIFLKTILLAVMSSNSGNALDKKNAVIAKRNMNTKIDNGSKNNFIFSFDFKKTSNPNAQRTHSEKIARKIILEGCIDETNGMLKKYGIFEIEFSSAKIRDKKSKKIKKVLCLFFAKNPKIAKLTAITPINETNSP